jgi:hypothetical protein
VSELSSSPNLVRPVVGDHAARLPARLYYGVIVAGVLVGIAACAATGWAYLEWDAGRPTGMRIWDGVADRFVVPICAMVGATFGGLLGVAAAVVWDLRRRRWVQSESGIHSVTS